MASEMTVQLVAAEVVVTSHIVGAREETAYIGLQFMALEEGAADQEIQARVMLEETEDHMAAAVAADIPAVPEQTD